MTDNVAETERQKYEKMYAHETYKSHPHSIVYADMLLARVSWKPGDDILDIGCGPGYASMHFKEKGFNVTGIDIAHNSLIPEYRGQFPTVIGPLWNLPQKVNGKFGLCADVMEHIPPDRVDQVLEVIRSSVEDAVFFNICFRMDGYGRLIGERLHMTIESKEWWEEKLRTKWKEITFTGGKPNDHGNFLVRP